MSYDSDKNKIIDLLETHDLIDAGTVKTKLKVHYLTARNYLQKMVNEGILEILEIPKTKYVHTYYKYDKDWDKYDSIKNKRNGL